MHVTGHAVWHLPLRDRERIEKRPIDASAERVDVATDSGRVHGFPLYSGYQWLRAHEFQYMALFHTFEQRLASAQTMGLTIR
jgi:hypothetical protein